MARGNLYDNLDFSPREKKVICYLTEEEFEELEEIVVRENISKSDYVRDRLFENPVEESLNRIERKLNTIMKKLEL